MQRAAGVLLHISSLPSAFGVGDLGPEARTFAGWLADAGQSWWQLLPLTPTSPGLGDSPYSGFSAFAGHPLFISPDGLADEGLLSKADLKAERIKPSAKVDFVRAHETKNRFLSKAFEAARATLEEDPGFRGFCRDNAFWLEDFALFMAVKDHFGGRSWTDWDPDIRDREPGAVDRWRRKLAGEVLFRKFCQHRFYMQWGALRAHLDELDLGVIGDAPIYVSHDSADVWANRRLFKLGPAGELQYVAGVPPDYFSETGQRWGNPVFDWKASQDQGFSWWIARLRHNFGLFDMIRLDHFRGFAAYWEIPAGEKTAVRGRWVRSPGRELLARLREQAGEVPMIAEDLGVITKDVVALKDDFSLPGMKILQFAFPGERGSTSRDIPYQHERNSVVYTGTHDNNTTLGWWTGESSPAQRAMIAEYLGKRVTKATICRDLMRLAMGSVGALSVVPVQDILELGADARMNTPSTGNSNWAWRLLPGALDAPLAREMADLASLYGRAGNAEVELDDYPGQKKDAKTGDVDRKEETGV